MESYLLKEYKHLRTQMMDVISDYVSADVVESSAEVIITGMVKKYLEKNGESVPESLSIDQKSVDFELRKFDLIADAAPQIAGFFILANQFDEAVDIEDKLNCLFGMNNTLGATAGIVGYGIKSKKDARRGAAVKLANDPKQEAKRFVRECWLEWQANPGNYKSQAKFARDMLDKCQSLENQVSIENWCREWKKPHLAS